MTRSDKTLIALNSLLGIWAFMALASQDPEALIVGSLLAMAIASANIGMAVKRRRAEGLTKRSRRTQETDEMSAGTVLDLDARLEALERARSADDDAARLWAMAQSGMVSAPSAEADPAHIGDAARAQRESA